MLGDLLGCVLADIEGGSFNRLLCWVLTDSKEKLKPRHSCLSQMFRRPEQPAVLLTPEDVIPPERGSTVRESFNWLNFPERRFPRSIPP